MAETLNSIPSEHTEGTITSPERSMSARLYHRAKEYLGTIRAHINERRSRIDAAETAQLSEDKEVANLIVAAHDTTNPATPDDQLASDLVGEEEIIDAEGAALETAHTLGNIPPDELAVSLQILSENEGTAAVGVVCDAIDAAERSETEQKEEESSTRKMITKILRGWAETANSEAQFDLYDESLDLCDSDIRELVEMLSETRAPYRGLSAFRRDESGVLVLREEYRGVNSPDELLYASEKPNERFNHIALEVIAGLIAAILKYIVQRRIPELSVEMSAISDPVKLSILREEDSKIRSGEYPDSVTDEVIDILTNVSIEELLDDYKTFVEQDLSIAINDRIASNEYPWTIPDAKCDTKKYGQIRDLINGIIGDPLNEHGDRCFEPKPDDIFNVRPLFGSGGFCKDDQALVGHQEGSYSRGFTRQELKDKGVFFVNSVGDGEQPIFGVPIPDEAAEDGYFHPEKRVFLTETEFKKVYEYQMKMLAETGIDLSSLDIPDIQRSLIMICILGKQNSKDVEVIDYAGRERDASGGKQTKVPKVGDVHNDSYGARLLSYPWCSVLA